MVSQIPAIPKTNPIISAALKLTLLKLMDCFSNSFYERMIFFDGISNHYNVSPGNGPHIALGGQHRVAALPRPDSPRSTR